MRKRNLRDLSRQEAMSSDCLSRTPRHVAIIMDGNRRWAAKRGLPSAVGHASGARRVQQLVQGCFDRGISYLTLFAFSTENWRRPPDEVTGLMGLFALYLQKEISNMNAKGVRLKIVGDTSRFDARIQALIRDAETHTAHNEKLTLTIAANYGGRWDVLQAVQAWQRANPGATSGAISEESLQPYFSLAHAPDPDLLIRTGGESRISNFMLWQLAYTELYFSDVLWPSFSLDTLDLALAFFASRDRRFGGTAAPRVASCH